ILARNSTTASRRRKESLKKNPYGNMNHNIRIGQELALSARQVSTVISLLDDGGTIPFIARYRKEMTGSLDEVQLTQIRDRLYQLRELDKRREAILKSLLEQD